MKRLLEYLAGLALVVAAVLGIAYSFGLSTNHDDKSLPTGTQDFSSAGIPDQKRACGIFNLAEAKQLLGDNAKGGQNPAKTSSKDVDVSTCSYLQDISSSNAPVSSGKSASLTVKIPKTENGKSSNRGQFGTIKPDNVEDIGGYGDNAFWDPQRGQLNILKNDTWYILSNGPASPDGRTLDDAKQMADLLINKM